MPPDQSVPRKKAVTGLLLLGVALLIVFRQPAFFLTPRFWAEEGANYFAYAWQNGFREALFVQHFGYYAIVPTLATALATLVPLEHAPLLTTLVAALFQFLVSALVIGSDSPFWDTTGKKILLAFAIQLCNPFEVWLTTIASQYWLTIALFLILLANRDRANRPTIWFHRTMVLVGGLSGGQPLFLAPAYLLKAWQSRRREEWLLTAVLFASGIVQAAALYGAKAGHDPYLQTRFGAIDFNPGLFLSWHFIEPYLSASLLNLNGVIALDNAWAALTPAWAGSFSRLVALAAITGGTALLVIRKRAELHCRLFCIAYLFVTVMSTLLSLRMFSSPRYAFAPSVMLLALFIGYLPPAVLGRPLRIFSALFLSLFFISALLDIRSPGKIYYQADFPDWQQEVAAWRSDPSRELMIWPQFVVKQWSVTLDRGKERH